MSSKLTHHLRRLSVLYLYLRPPTMTKKLPYFQIFAHSSTHHHYCLLLSVSSVGELIHFLFPHTGHTKDTIIFTPCLYHSAFLTVNDTTKQHNGATHRIATKQNKTKLIHSRVHVRVGHNGELIFCTMMIDDWRKE